MLQSVPSLRRPELIVALLVLTLSSAPGFAQKETDNRVDKANYKLAARFAPSKWEKLVFSTRLRPNWLEHSDGFWYRWETPAGEGTFIVDPAAKTKRPLFDHVKMAAELTRLTKDPYDAQHLPIRNIKFINEDQAIRFEVESSQEEEVKEEEKEEEEQEQQEQRGRRPRTKKKVLYFQYDLANRTVRLLQDYEEPRERPDWASISPDGNVIVFSRDHNLFLMDKENYEKALKDEKDPDTVEHQLTTDGEEHYSYGSRERGQTDKEKEKNKGKRQGVSIVWSKDSGKFGLVRRDQRKVADLWVINSVAQPRPTIETYRYDMPGEKNVSQTEIHVFDVASRAQLRIDAGRFVDQTLSIVTARPSVLPADDGPRPRLWLADNPNQLYFTRTSRDLKKIDFCVAQTASGDVTVLVEERMNTYLETQRPELIGDGEEFIHWSERDGWGHYYLYDAEGNLKHQITSGPFSTREILGVDQQQRVLYFTATGVDQTLDPYFEQAYRIGLDGTGMKLLTPGDAAHSVSMGESTKYFVDNFSRVDTTPAAHLLDVDGNVVMDLETTDLSLLKETGYQFPERFKVKADDGITDLYGVMYKPFDFDPDKKYPIIAYVYPGPQTESVPKAFSTSSANVGLAQFGFIVIAVGNRGGHPHRSKWYHNYGYGNLRDYGLADKKAAIEQLADRYDFIDIDRVGIYGHSGGGFMSTAALLVYPDFFKVAVSSSGNHENNIYNRRWSEKHHGVKEVVDKEGNVSFEYAIEKNSELAGNLKGKLLLATGDIDNNVHPGNTFRMANALIKANKRFDLFVFPGVRHSYRPVNDYWFWLRGDYFSRHLLGDAPESTDIVELNREKEQTGNKRRRY